MRKSCTQLLAAVIVLGLESCSVKAEDCGLSRVLALKPRAATNPDETHAVMLVTRKRYSKRVTFAARVKTVKHLRTGSPANPWESAWIVWHYTDEDHFYYLAIKPNGWELGKRDPSYPGGQRFLASGERKFPLGVWHRFEIRQDATTVVARLNGRHVTRFQDTERPYTSGQIGLYTEDAEVQIDDITAPFTENFESYKPQTNKTDGAIIKKWIVPFLGFGYAAIVDR